MANVTLGLLFEKYNGYQKEGQKIELSASESKLLFSQINATEYKALNGIFPTGGKLSVVESFLASLTLYVSMSKDKAKYFGAPLNESFIEYIEKFAAQECENLSNFEG